MKSTKFSFFLIFFLSFFLIEKAMSQEFRCGTPPFPEEKRAELMRKLGRTGSRNNNCTDATWSGGDQKYNLVIEYSEPLYTTANAEKLRDYIKTYYLQYGIEFNVSLQPVNCTDCFEFNSGSWGSSLLQPKYPNCIHLRRVTGTTGGTATWNGTCWAGDDVSCLHEIGHELGLQHTFGGSWTQSSHEVIKSSNSCTCNCLIEGDWICATPADPYINPQPPFEQQSRDWNNDMFDYQNGKYKNIREIKDMCGTDYINTPNQNKILSNLMSYHRPQIFLIKEQVDYMKLYSTGKPWNVSGLTGTVNSSPGYSINSATLMSSDIIFTSDVTVNSTLRIENCKVYFANGAKLVLNSGSTLKLNNATITNATHDLCTINTSEWSGIQVLGKTQIVLSNNSEISNSKNACISSTNNFVLLSLFSGSRISNFRKDALRIVGGKGLITLNSNSSATGEIYIANFYGSLNATDASFKGRKSGGIFMINSNLRLSKCKIDVTVNVINTQLKNLFIEKSIIEGGMNLTNPLFPIHLIDNQISKTVFIREASTFDIAKNNFYTVTGGLNFVNSSINNSSLLFKNTFNIGPLKEGINISVPSPGINLECNNFSGPFREDINVTGSIAPTQGDRELAAGNSFSRSGTEINWNNPNKVDYYYIDKGTQDPINISGNKDFFRTFENIGSTKSKCDLSYPPVPDHPSHCYNGQLDGDEKGIDCDGSCPPCVLVSIDNPINRENCGDGIQNNGETGIDCGGKHCPPCNTCNDGIQNNGETGVDCGGPLCPPCNTAYCNNGIMDNGETGVDCGGPCPPCNGTPPPVTGSCFDGNQNNGETGVDCGGPNCPPCNTTYCNNGIQDHGETGVDCGGPCPACTRVCNYDGVRNNGEQGIDCGGPCPPCVIITYLPTCYDGIRNGGETGIDCGGPCPPCKTWTNTGGGSEGGTNQGGGSSGRTTWFKQQTAAAASGFITTLNGIYGNNVIPPGDDLDIRSDKQNLKSLMDGGNTGNMLHMIRSVSASRPADVSEALRNASPYVSAEAMHTLFEHGQHFTKDEVADIIRRNPGVVSDPYVNFVVYVSGSLTPLQTSAIDQAVKSGDGRIRKNEDIRIRDHYMQSLIRNHLLAATEGNTPDYDEMRSLILKKNHPDIVYEIYQTFIDEGQYQFATAYLNMHDLSEITDPYYRNQLLQFRKLHEILMHYYYAGNRGILMPATVKSNLNTIALGCNGYASSLARNVIYDLFGDDLEYNHACTKYTSPIFKNNIDLRHAHSISFSLYPNPASDHIEILASEVPAEDTQILIYDVTGKEVISEKLNGTLTKISVNALPSGVFSYRIFTNNKNILSDKFIKIK